MKRVIAILATTLLASSVLTSAEARGDRDGSSIGAGASPAGLRVAVYVGGVTRAGMKRSGGNHTGRGGHDLDFAPHAMDHLGRFSSGYGVYDSYNPNCNMEATEGDEFPCLHAMDHFRRFSSGYGLYDSHNPNCNMEATEGDEFPCLHAMDHLGRFSPGYGVHDSYNPNCNMEATEGDEFPCLSR
jgi:hypothetical protein